MARKCFNLAHLASLGSRIAWLGRIWNEGLLMICTGLVLHRFLSKNPASACGHAAATDR